MVASNRKEELPSEGKEALINVYKAKFPLVVKDLARAN